MRSLVITFLLVSLAACATSRSVRHGDAYSHVVHHLDDPAETRVFLKGQHSPSELPAAVWIGNVGLGSSYSSATVELARREGRRLKADFVIVYTASGGPIGVLGLSAFRIVPASLGYVQEEGLVKEITSPETASAGLRVGDRILEIYGVPFSARIKPAFECQPGAVVPVRIQRSGAEHRLQIRALPNPPKHLGLDEPKSL